MREKRERGGLVCMLLILAIQSSLYFFLSLFSSLHLSALLTFHPLRPFIASFSVAYPTPSILLPSSLYCYVSLLFSPFLPICIEDYFVRTFFFTLQLCRELSLVSVLQYCRRPPPFHTSQIDFCVHRRNRSLILFKAAI